MAATALEKVRDYTGNEYKYGFVTDIEARLAPNGLSEDSRPPHLGQEGRAGLDDRVAAGGATARWLTMKEPTGPEVSYPPIDYQAISYYSAPKAEGRGRSRWTRSIPSCCATYDEARHPDPRAGDPGRRRRRLRVRQRLGRDHVQGQARRARHHLLLDVGGGPRASGAGAPVSRLGRAAGRQLLRRAEFGRVLRRLASSTCPRACAARWSCRPTSGSTPPSTGQFERTLIIADEGAYVSYLEGCTAPHARREPAARRGGRAGRARRRRDQVLDRAELVSRRQARARAASTISSPSAAPAAAATSKITWTQVETGSAITWKYPSCILQGDDSVGEFYSVRVTNNRQQADTGTKMIHIGKNTRSRIVSKGISAGRRDSTYRGLVRVLKAADGARNHTQCDSPADRRPLRRAHGALHRGQEPPRQVSSTRRRPRKISDDQLFYCRSRGMSDEDAVALIVNGFCRR